MEHSENEQHIEDLKRTLHELVDEAEKPVENLEAELAQARLAVARMRKAVADVEKPL
jgi:hypothetical protein